MALAAAGRSLVISILGGGVIVCCRDANEEFLAKAQRSAQRQRSSLARKRSKPDTMNLLKAHRPRRGRGNKPADEEKPKNLIFLGRLLCALCADLCVFARDSLFPIWPRTELVRRTTLYDPTTQS